nr:copper chaperone PCu(A)C [uncultured Pseudomonas sp.]
MVRLSAFSLCLMALLASLAFAASAGDEREATGLSARAGWAFPVTADAPFGMVFLLLNNRGDKERVLQGASSPVADKIELHAAVADLSPETTRPVESMAVSPESDLIFAPGGPHLMLIGLKQALEVGEQFPVTLHFDDGDSIALDVTVAKQAPAHFRH